MSNSIVNSPNSTFETEDTIRMNSSIASTSSNANMNPEQLYQFDNNGMSIPFQPLPPPPISVSASNAHHLHQNLQHSNSSFQQHSQQHQQQQPQDQQQQSSSQAHPQQYQPQIHAQAQQPDAQQMQNLNLNPDLSFNDFSIPNSSQYSIFSNSQAMNSLNSFHNDMTTQTISGLGTGINTTSAAGLPENTSGHMTSSSNPPIFKLNMDSTSDLLNDYSVVNNQSAADSMYNISEFDLGNPSFDSIPDSINDSNHHAKSSFDLADSLSGNLFNFQPLPFQPQQSSSLPANSSSHPLHSNMSTSQQLQDIMQYPYTPTISDAAFTPTMSDSSSFTPNSSTMNEDYIKAPIPLKSGHYHHNHMHSSTTPPLSQHHQHLNASSKVSKKPSLNRLNNSINNKKNLVISTQLSNSGTPLSESSPQFIGISPLCNKYKGLEINNPRINQSVMPPLNVFRHNSDSSSNSSYYSKTEDGPRRAVSSSKVPYPTLNEVSSNQRRSVSRKTSKNSLNTIGPGEDDGYCSPQSISSLSTTPTNSTTPNVSKPKKYTRRRLLPRSKSGCWICRIKHLKCDEIRPVCTSCAKFGIDCDYSQEKPQYVTDKNLRKEKLESISLIRKQKQSLNKSSKSKFRSENPLGIHSSG